VKFLRSTSRETLPKRLMRSNFLFGRICIVVANDSPGDITGMLAAWSEGQAAALNQLMDLICPALRRIAHQHLERRRPGDTLESAALAFFVYNQEWRTLIQGGEINATSVPAAARSGDFSYLSTTIHVPNTGDPAAIAKFAQ
jgi:hypothetical protein